MGGAGTTLTSRSKKCKFCSVELTVDNASKKNTKYWRNECKPCRSKSVITYQKNNHDNRKVYMREWVRKSGRVKQYPCEYCQKPCYKKYKNCFCSDRCRFMSYVKMYEDCWLWIGPLNRGGYGKFCFGNIKSDTAHRVSYKIFKGDIPDGMFICHSCDVRNCVKPEHLWIGDHQENMLDMIEKGRQRSKLTFKDVFKIRELVEKFGFPQSKVVKMFNLTSGTVSSIIHRRIWKHV